MFVPFDSTARVHLGVVSLGTPTRLSDCLQALRTHESQHDFVASVCVNLDAMAPRPLAVDVPDGMRVERPLANLGWGGGLGRLRTLADSEYFVWVQDDMLPEPGWLDALVAAADAHPSVALFGALRVGPDGTVMLHNGGLARPPDAVDGWNRTDTTVDATPTEVTVLDWVTSKGCLVRTAAFDETGGPDPRLWPLNHVDKEFSTHLRCHGWDVALVPSARLQHAQSQSSPSSFRVFLNEWRDDWFDRRWAAPATALAGLTSAVVEHPCSDWHDERPDLLEALSGREATKMLVPFARFYARLLADAHADAVRAHADAGALRARVATLESRLRTSRRRRHRLRNRVSQLESRLEDRSPGARTTRQRRVRRRLTGLLRR